MKKDARILLVEDSDEDYETTLRAFRNVQFSNEIFRCEDADDALDYLLKRGKHIRDENSPNPSIILLDLNLPGTDGREFLVKIKQDPKLRSIPVVVLTTSADERDIKQSYEAGASSFIQKPVSFEGFVEAVKRLKDYWFDIVLLANATKKE